MDFDRFLVNLPKNSANRESDQQTLVPSRTQSPETMELGNDTDLNDDNRDFYEGSDAEEESLKDYKLRVVPYMTRWRSRGPNTPPTSSKNTRDSAHKRSPTLKPHRRASHPNYQQQRRESDASIRKRARKEAAEHIARLEVEKAQDSTAVSLMNEGTADEETEEETEEEDDRHEKDVSPPLRKRVKRTPEQKVTFYVNIQTAVNTVTKGRGGMRKSNSGRIMQLGPFITTNPPSESFREFQDRIATTVRCRVTKLPMQELKWRYETPKSSPEKPLSNETGYEAMRISLGARKKDFVVCISLPTPLKDNFEWSADNEPEGQEPFDYHGADAASEPEQDTSAKGMIAAIQKKSGAYMQQLLEMYPRDNSPLFPNARIYTKNVAGNDLYWNLSDLCLQVWANKLEIGNDPDVTLTQPPNSIFFAVDKCIKPRKQTSLATPGSAATTPAADTPAVLIPAETQARLPPSLPPSTIPMLPPSQMYSYPLLWQYHSGPMPPVPPMAPMPPFYPPFNPYGYQPELHSRFPPNVLAPIPMKQHRSMDSSPGRKALGLKISLDDFCARYDIPDTQKHALASLGYVPGLRHIEQLSPAEWQSTGLGILQQRLILDHHIQFLQDAEDGKWAK